MQQLVVDWQNHITQYYYNCTPYILQGLGEMYVADERFKAYYEKIKPGLSEFFSEAIEYYCDNIIK
ncbi:TipAS antibiotic-recognition domain-containing protein [bacterium]|nr:TipAS antibiotic-recognition domain-containing protein [bacterium]